MTGFKSFDGDKKRHFSFLAPFRTLSLARPSELGNPALAPGASHAVFTFTTGPPRCVDWHILHGCLFSGSGLEVFG
jgi:hypothetical protein